MTALFAPPGVLTMPASAPFLPALARGLLDALDRPESPFALSDAVVLLPTRRAARGLAQALLDARGEAAMLLPRIRTLGDLDPAEAGLAELGEPIGAAPAIAPLARQFALAKLVQARDSAAAWSADPVSALAAADALAGLLDSAELVSAGEGGFDWSRLDTLVQDRELAEHWELSTQFLRIVTEAWPAHLRAFGLTDPGGRQRRGLEALAARWRAEPPGHTVVLAGSTGAIPATRALMAVVAGLPRGCVVLPGLDQDLPDRAWADAARDDQHPQRGLAQVLADLGLQRGQVGTFPGAEDNRGLALRRRVLNEALAPQAATADWRGRVDQLAAEYGPGAVREGLDGLSLIEAASEEEEAAAIALELRATLEQPGATAALVTPDITIARRVAAKMARWGVQVDVSAGQSLGETPVGVFFRLVAEWVADPACPVRLTAMLAHPLAALGQSRQATQAAAAHLEITCLRGARKDATLHDTVARLETIKAERWRSVDAAAQARDLLARLQAAATPWPERAGLHEVARQVAEACEALAASVDPGGATPGADRLWRGEAGEALARFLSDLMEHGPAFGPVAGEDLPRVLAALMAPIVVRPRGSHPRLHILGPLEARMLSHDTLVLAGLDEGVWPGAPPVDPFLSRPMRADLGLPPPEARIGLSAHDFAQLAAQPHVVLTRSARRKDAPAVPSRWLWRLKTLAAGALGVDGALEALSAPSGFDSLALVRAQEPLRTFNPARAQPKPTPPVAARPVKLSATQVETWVRDPYRLYVEQILKLRALDPLGGAPGISERGTAMHAAAEVVASWPGNLPADPEAALREAFSGSLAKAGFAGPALAAEMARLDATIAWFAREELARIENGWRARVEAWGETRLDSECGSFTLVARADRVDVRGQEVEILDFKSGTPPKPKAVATMLSPQLPLTALIASRGGFKSVPATVAVDLRHIRLGGREPGPVAAVKADTDVATLVAAAERTVLGLQRRYADPDRTYLSKPRVNFSPKTNYEDPVDLLARRFEWASAEGEE